MKYKLNFELVPKSAWGCNLRKELSKKEWDKLRHEAYSRANGYCAICGKKVDQLEAHEVWDFNIKKKTQKLVNIIGICKKCHNTIHIGLAQIKGFEQEAIKQFMEVNECDIKECLKAKEQARKIYNEKSKINKWNLDVSFLDGTGIQIKNTDVSSGINI